MQNIACACQSFLDYFLLFTGLIICFDNLLLNIYTLTLIFTNNLIDVSAGWYRSSSGRPISTSWIFEAFVLFPKVVANVLAFVHALHGWWANYLDTNQECQGGNKKFGNSERLGRRRPVEAWFILTRFISDDSVDIFECGSNTLQKCHQHKRKNISVNPKSGQTVKTMNIFQMRDIVCAYQ